MYKLSYFNFEKFAENRFLLTNDLGRFVFLDSAAFTAMCQRKLDGGCAEYALLRDSGFLYEGSEPDYVREWRHDYRAARECLLSSTQLFILALTTACNQRCVYCQAGRSREVSFMSKEVCRKALDVAFQSPAAHITIEFQGGEPTLNPDVLRFAVPYAKRIADETGKQVHFALVTNLTDPDAVLLEWLICEGVGISTSLDGPQSLHDRNRPLAAGESAYAKWRAGLTLCRELCAKHGISDEIGAIQTTTRASLEYPREIVEAYIENGYHALYVRPLTPLGCAAEEWAEIGYTAEEYLRFYAALLDELIRRCKEGYFIAETTASLYLRRILRHESVGHTELRSPCGAAVGQMAINCDGQVYTCDEGRMLANMGDHAFRLGTVDDSYERLVTSPTAHAACTASCIEALPLCSGCVYSPFCSVCPVVNYSCEHDLISHDAHGYKCEISRGILRQLFGRLSAGTVQERAILERWAG